MSARRLLRFARKGALVYYALTIFLSAFLLFQVQPIISKRILPWFGGGPTVWTTCMLFFQVALLLGYLYAHVVGTRLRLKWQVTVHGLVMAGALVFLPIYASQAWKPETPEHPTLRIILLLFATVGLPYFALSTTSPLLQKWFTVANPDARVYRFYSLSNAGSLLALITYPSVIEPTFTGRSQAWWWSAGFGLFVALCGYSAFLAWKTSQRRTDQLDPINQETQNDAVGGGAARSGERPSVFQFVMWLMLAACASTMLLAATNQICLDVAVVPFLWVLPLGLYLLTFIICFDRERWYYRPVFWPLMVLMCGLLAWYIHAGISASIFTQIAVFALGLFACCMVCHGELVRLKPSPRHLTSFYLMVAAGGALGGIFVAVIAPHVFVLYTELSVGIAASFAVAATVLLYDLRRRSTREKPVPVFSVGVIAAMGFVALVVGLGITVVRSHRDCVAVARNFYGVLRVEEYRKKASLHSYALLHGRIVHGVQFTSEDLRRHPTFYYGEQSGAGLTLRSLSRRPALRVGLVGLGAGTLDVYGRPQDHYTFYEIDPNVKKMATTWFTYLSDSKAKWDIVLGDGRLSLERELRNGAAHQFDVLVLDAFSGDAIPVHLLTREAFETYMGLLKPGGVIAVHVTNRHFDLRPVVRGAASKFDLKAVWVSSPEDRTNFTASADWMLVTANEQFLSELAAANRIRQDADSQQPIVWTDDFSNLFQVIR